MSWTRIWVSVHSIQCESLCDICRTDIEAEDSLPMAADTIPFNSRLHGELAMNLHKAWSQSQSTSQSGTSSVPRSFEEFSLWMTGQNQATTSLLDGVSKGTYAHLGLKAAASKTPSTSI